MHKQLSVMAALLLTMLLAMFGAENGIAQTPSSGPATNLPAQAIGANDLIAISIYDAPEFNRTLRVGSNGEIALPMIRRKIRAQGLMPDALELDITAILESENILVDPLVTVTIVEYSSRPISVVGAVRRPVTFQASAPVTLLDAITRADGLSTDAGSEILITRTRTSASGETVREVERIPVAKLMDETADDRGSPIKIEGDLNLILYGGEQVRIPEVGKVFVMGNVRKPGTFNVQDASGTTILKILALSEGLSPFAAKRAFIYRRVPGSSEPEEIPIELAKILERKSKDLALIADDILYIPDSKGRRLTATALDRLAGFGASTATGMLVWRR